MHACHLLAFLWCRIVLWLCNPMKYTLSDITEADISSIIFIWPSSSPLNLCSIPLDHKICGGAFIELCHNCVMVGFVLFCPNVSSAFYSRCSVYFTVNIAVCPSVSLFVERFLSIQIHIFVALLHSNLPRILPMMAQHVCDTVWNSKYRVSWIFKWNFD